MTMTSLPNQKSLRVVSYATFPSKYMKLAVAATDFYGFAAHFVDWIRTKTAAPVGWTPVCRTKSMHETTNFICEW